MKGIFITIEGPDGAGKTSVLQEVLPQLKEMTRREIVATREPGGIPIAEEIREVILHPKNTAMDERTEALLFAASRRQHLVEKIIPALNRGAIVIADRFVDSSLAYQGAGRGLGMDEIAQINLFATEGITPDLTIYLDVDSETGLSRIANSRMNEVNRLDLDAMSFHQRVRHGYLKLLELYPERIKKVDARLSLPFVIEQVMELLVDEFPTEFSDV
ncbi:dTMP kinase [Pilibacter termitis]|uniref:Thymidylate kinase n=1 Tax=Pilibacter termitis TaxID=263852 RepID=A0A1T4PBA0_9ENTE|nr:dTMP kinase [Pilibacter termitis]SJZ88794.1 dTMP kinase [Pilibacter termitis]